MTILAAAALDFIEQLKQRSRGWIYEPLVVINDDKLKHSQFVTVKVRPNNHTSATQFYIENPPTGVLTLIKAKTKGQYPRLIELCLAPGPDAKLHVKYWRMNGWRQNKMSIEDGRHLHNHKPVQQDGKTNFKVYAMERIIKRNRRSGYIHRDVIDLTSQESVEYVANLAALTLEKSLGKIHGAATSHKNRRIEKLSKWNFHMAIILDGMNFMYEGDREERGIVYG